MSGPRVYPFARSVKKGDIMIDEELVRSMPRLGFGLMRLPRADVEKDQIDIPQTCRMVDAFLAAGGKYFDSAYVYNGSEEAAKAALTSRYPRDSYFITSKLNVNAKGITDESSAKAEFEESLRREGVDYIDFYLLHAVSSRSLPKFDKWHLWDFVRDLKAQGKIRHYGFSFHDKAEVLDKILTDHPDVEFVQLQLNYADWESLSVQSRLCYETARKHGKPIVVMEPIKGGTLADPPKPVKELLHAANPDASYASWAIRFVASLPGILTVLSGMSDMQQMEDNLSYMKDFKPLTEEERDVIRKAQDILETIEQIPCTGCHYCTGGCPEHINIPDIFSAMNLKLIYDNEVQAKRKYSFQVGNGHGGAGDCIHCGQCEIQCPQKIHIRDWMDRIAKELA